MIRCLSEIDISGIRRLWRHVSPNIPPMDDQKTLVAIHMARTQTASLSISLRAYSHRWLCDRDFQSHLPDDLKPKAERIYPKIVQGVGISVNFTSPILKPAGKIIERAMADAVEDAYSQNKRDPEFIRFVMSEARQRTIVQLFGKR